MNRFQEKLVTDVWTDARTDRQTGAHTSMNSLDFTFQGSKQELKENKDICQLLRLSYSQEDLRAISQTEAVWK